MKNVKLGHALSFYMHIKVFSLLFSKKILGLSKAKGFLSPPYLLMANFECSVPIYSGPWLDTWHVTKSYVKIGKPLQTEILQSHKCKQQS